MRVIEARNIHEALPKAVRLLQDIGVPRASRNGPVLVAPCPVTTTYYKPQERVIFWPQRDANPAFHLFESLWMLAGRNDVAPLLRYVKDFGRFSDDGETLYGAYGWRWRKSHDDDQLAVIAERLRRDPDDRRCVLQMWDGPYDLGRDSKDVPCNLICTFQVSPNGALDLTVFCRSNDIVWGAYGANAVHFSMLLEYMAIWIDRPVGVYRQISVNWHAYVGEPWEKATTIPPEAFKFSFAHPVPIPNPYASGAVRSLPMMAPRHGETGPDVIKRLDAAIRELLMHADTGFELARRSNDDEPWVEAAYAVLMAHERWRKLAAPQRFTYAIDRLKHAYRDVDWIVAMQEWLDRRRVRWELSQPQKAEV